MNQLTTIAERNGLKVRACHLLGPSAGPTPFAAESDKHATTNGKSGFDTRCDAMNRLLSFAARCEPLPQRILGTSIMAVLENQNQETESKEEGSPSL